MAPPAADQRNKTAEYHRFLGLGLFRFLSTRCALTKFSSFSSFQFESGENAAALDKSPSFK